MMTYEEAYLDLWQTVYKYCLNKIKNHQNAEDITSDVFLLLYEKWDTLDTHEKSAMLAWLLRCTRYKVFDHFRKNHVTYLDDMEPLLSPPEDFIFTDEDERLYKHYAAEIIRRLPKKEGTLFEYVIIAGKSFKEISSITNISAKALEIRWYRIRKRIKTFISEVIP